MEIQENVELPEEEEQIEAVEQEPEEQQEEESDDGIIAALEEELDAGREPESDESPEPEVGDEKSDEPTEDDPQEETPPEPEPEAEPEAKADEGKPSDEFGELDKKTPEKTRDRFQAVKSKYDEIHHQLEERAAEVKQIRDEADQWVTAIRDTGTTPEQFGETLQFLREMNSGDPVNLERAYEYLSGLQANIGKKIGRGADGYDPLEDFPDLKERVSDGYLERGDAEELAKARKVQEQAQANRQEQQQSSQEQEELAQGMLELKTLGESLQQDPAFQYKFPMIKGLIENLPNTGLPPSKWKDTIANAYNAITIPVADPRPKVQAPDPLRPSPASPANAAMQADPGNELEALDQALERGW